MCIYIHICVNKHVYIYIFIIGVYIYYMLYVCVGVFSFIDVARHPSPTPLFSCQPHLFIPAIDCHGIHELILQNCLGQLQAYTVQSLGHGHAWYTYTLRWICPHLAFTNPVGASGACKVTDTTNVVMAIPRRLSKHIEQKQTMHWNLQTLKHTFWAWPNIFFWACSMPRMAGWKIFMNYKFQTKRLL